MQEWDGKGFEWWFEGCKSGCEVRQQPQWWPFANATQRHIAPRSGSKSCGTRAATVAPASCTSPQHQSWFEEAPMANDSWSPAMCVHGGSPSTHLGAATSPRSPCPRAPAREVRLGRTHALKYTVRDSLRTCPAISPGVHVAGGRERHCVCAARCNLCDFCVRVGKRHTRGRHLLAGAGQPAIALVCSGECTRIYPHVPLQQGARVCRTCCCPRSARCRTL